MRTQHVFALLAVAVTLAGCTSKEQICSEKIAKLGALRQETLANLFRQKAECQAVAIEFNGDAFMVENCLNTFRTMQEMAQQTIENIDKRYSEDDMVACVALNQTGR